MGNTYLVPDGPGGILDWQFTRSVPRRPRRCLLPDDRPRHRGSALAHERELIAHYCEELHAHSVEDVTPAALFELYRKDAMWGVLMWMLTPSSMHRQEILETSFLRCLRATEDLETFGALGC